MCLLEEQGVSGEGINNDDDGHDGNNDAAAAAAQWTPVLLRLIKVSKNYQAKPGDFR